MPRLTRFSGALRPCTAFLLYVCAWATFPPAYADQQAPAEPQSFAAATRRAIAHGRPADAEALAKQKPATDGAAAGVLGQLAAMRGRYEEAIALLEPAAVKEPGSEAALQLGLIEQQLGRAQQATRHLTDVLEQGASGRDIEGVFRAARAAQALGRPRDANSLFKAAAAGSADPAVDTAWGLLFLEKYNKPEALRSLQDALKRSEERRVGKGC